MIDLPDVDIEVLDRDTVAQLFPEAHPASQQNDSGLTRHKSGLYFQDIPVTPDGLAALPFRMAEEKGFYKVDLLSAPFPYDGITSMQELRDWMAKPIDWDWFTDTEFVAKLFHLGGTVYFQGGIFVTMAEVVRYYQPRSIDDLACLIAIKIPPKTKLIGEDWSTVRQHIWVRDRSENFKKSHAIAYALVVALNARRLANDR